MVGILSYGAYIPTWRLSRDEIARASGIPIVMPGERAVAAWDEDSLTMATEAGLDCLNGIDPKEIDGIFFATTTSPFKEKQSSSLIASALDLRKDILTSDFANSLRAGTIAVKAAMDAVEAKTARKILVVSADRRVATPASIYEQIFGDGAAALLIGEDGIAEIEGFYTVRDAIPGPWRRDVDDYPKEFAPKLDLKYGFMKNLPEAISGLMKKCNLTPKDISKIAFYAPDPRTYLRSPKLLGVEMEKIQDPLFLNVGITGTPHCLLLLVSALETAKPNERILCASYGDGSDAFVVRTTDKVEEIKGKRRGVSANVKSSRTLPTYEKYADFRRVRETAWPKWSKVAHVMYWRDEKSILPLYGMKCKNCGTLSYPLGRCCVVCGAKDNHEEVKLARRGKIFTYTLDYLIGPGNTEGDGVNPGVRAVIDLEDGCRMFLEIVDCEPKDIQIDTPVELTFRLLNEKSDFKHYGWRARPVRA
jgi:hydroxymethylglutaryl-CoA synthase